MWGQGNVYKQAEDVVKRQKAREVGGGKGQDETTTKIASGSSTAGNRSNFHRSKSGATGGSSASGGSVSWAGPSDVGELSDEISVASSVSETNHGDTMLLPEEVPDFVSSMRSTCTGSAQQQQQQQQQNPKVLLNKIQKALDEQKKREDELNAVVMEHVELAKARLLAGNQKGAILTMKKLKRGTQWERSRVIKAIDVLEDHLMDFKVQLFKLEVYHTLLSALPSSSSSSSPQDNYNTNTIALRSVESMGDVSTSGHGGGSSPPVPARGGNNNNNKPPSTPILLTMSELMDKHKTFAYEVHKILHEEDPHADVPYTDQELLDELATYS